MRSLIVGLGRSGAGLHLPVLRRLRVAHALGRPFTPAPIVGYDPAGVEAVGQAITSETMVRAASLGHASRLLVPRSTVVHLCTPPTVRVHVLAELAELGFRNILVEKPLAVGEHDLAEILWLRHRHGLRLAVVAPWLASELTQRLVRIAHNHRLGEPYRLSVVQNKPRFRRSLTTHGHPTAFDVELPHSLSVALRLAGSAEVAAASCADLVFDEQRLRWLGGASLRLRHGGGVLSSFESDLTAAVRERRITMHFECGTVTGHYAVDSDDCHAQLTVITKGERRHVVFRDDSLGTFLLDAYRRFHLPGDPWSADLDLAVDTVRLLTTAKKLSGITPEPLSYLPRSQPGPLTHVSRPAS